MTEMEVKEALMLEHINNLVNRALKMLKVAVPLGGVAAAMGMLFGPNGFASGATLGAIVVALQETGRFAVLVKLLQSGMSAFRATYEYLTSLDDDLIKNILKLAAIILEVYFKNLSKTSL